MATVEIDAEVEVRDPGLIPVTPPVAMETPVPVEVPRLNVFPVKVTVGETTYDKALVRTDGTTVEVWVENGHYPHDPIRAFLEEVTQVTNNTLNPRYPVSKQSADIETASGPIHVQRQGGCGCGSKLRSLPPTRFQSQHEQGTLAAAIRSHFPGAQI
jgi:hypothetical protein